MKWQSGLFSEEDRLLPDISTGMTVYVVGAKVGTRAFPGRHCRSAWENWSRLSARILRSTTVESGADPLLHRVSAIWLAFDGNGRMARLMHLWYLVQQVFSALFVPLSEYINKSRKGYYDAYTLVEENARISGVVDATPFLAYFIENVYHKLNGAPPAAQTTEAFQEALSHGQVTEKERALWEFVLSAYGDAEFSTAVGKGLRERRLRNDPQLCVEV